MPYTVTQRVYAVEQPNGGYLPPSAFSSKSYKDGQTLNAKENVHGKYVGLAVDYLTRFRMINDADVAFEISMLSAEILRRNYGQINQYNFCRQLLEAVKKGGIAEAIQLVAYDDVYRAGYRGSQSQSYRLLGERTWNTSSLKFTSTHCVTWKISTFPYQRRHAVIFC